MAYKKKFKKFKKYSSEQKLRYHLNRASAPGRYNLKYGGTKHSYSDGFCEAFSGINNEAATRAEFGKKSGNAYSIGHKRGVKAANEYFNRTGKQPFVLSHKLKSK